MALRASLKAAMEEKKSSGECSVSKYSQ